MRPSPTSSKLYTNNPSSVSSKHYTINKPSSSHHHLSTSRAAQNSSSSTNPSSSFKPINAIYYNDPKDKKNDIVTEKIKELYPPPKPKPPSKETDEQKKGFIDAFSQFLKKAETQQKAKSEVSVAPDYSAQQRRANSNPHHSNQQTLQQQQAQNEFLQYQQYNAQQYQERAAQQSVIVERIPDYQHAHQQKSQNILNYSQYPPTNTYSGSTNNSSGSQTNRKYINGQLKSILNERKLQSSASGYSSNVYDVAMEVFKNTDAYQRVQESSSAFTSSLDLSNSKYSKSSQYQQASSSSAMQQPAHQQQPQTHSQSYQNYSSQASQQPSQSLYQTGSNTAMLDPSFIEMYCQDPTALLSSFFGLKNFN